MNPMRVCLITPPSIFLLDERVFMTLGILRVAAALEGAGHEVELLDLSGIENFEEVIRLHSETSKADVFGLTATTPQMPAGFCAPSDRSRSHAALKNTPLPAPGS